MKRPWTKGPWDFYKIKSIGYAHWLQLFNKKYDHYIFSQEEANQAKKDLMLIVKSPEMAEFLIKILEDMQDVETTPLGIKNETLYDYAKEWEETAKELLKGIGYDG